MFFLSDIDLTGFGPYYGDVWSDLDDFEASLAKVRDEDADLYVTFHRRGVIEGREEFLRLLDGLAVMIETPPRGDARLPRRATDTRRMGEHLVILRPHVEVSFLDSVERRSAELHVARMVSRGEAVEVEPGRFQRVSARRRRLVCRTRRIACQSALR